MARKAARKSARKSGRKPARKSAKKTAKKSAKKTAMKSARKAPRARATARPARRASSSRKAATPAVRFGVITHTELASANPTATQQWCASVLGWKFGEAVPTPTGPYLMWRFENGTGGGIRSNNPPEFPGSIPYCEITDIQGTYSKALAAGAAAMVAPMQLPGGMGWVAIVAAPGGVPIGFWSAG